MVGMGSPRPQSCHFRRAPGVAEGHGIRALAGDWTPEAGDRGGGPVRKHQESTTLAVMMPLTPQTSPHLTPTATFHLHLAVIIITCILHNICESRGEVFCEAWAEDTWHVDQICTVQGCWRVNPPLILKALALHSGRESKSVKSQPTTTLPLGTRSTPQMSRAGGL